MQHGKHGRPHDPTTQTPPQEQTTGRLLGPRQRPLLKSNPHLLWPCRLAFLVRCLLSSPHFSGPSSSPARPLLFFVPGRKAYSVLFTSYIGPPKVFLVLFKVSPMLLHGMLLQPDGGRTWNLSRVVAFSFSGFLLSLRPFMVGQDGGFPLCNPPICASAM